VEHAARLQIFPGRISAPMAQQVAHGPKRFSHRRPGQEDRTAWPKGKKQPSDRRPYEKPRGLQARHYPAKAAPPGQLDQRRIATQHSYDKALKGAQVCIPKVRKGRRDVFHSICVSGRRPDRATVQAKARSGTGSKTAPSITQSSSVSSLLCPVRHKRRTAPSRLPASAASSHSHVPELTEHRIAHSLPIKGNSCQ